MYDRLVHRVPITISGPPSTVLAMCHLAMCPGTRKRPEVHTGHRWTRCFLLLMTIAQAGCVEGPYPVSHRPLLQIRALPGAAMKRQSLESCNNDKQR